MCLVFELPREVAINTQYGYPRKKIQHQQKQPHSTSSSFCFSFFQTSPFFTNPPPPSIDKYVLFFMHF